MKASALSGNAGRPKRWRFPIDGEVGYRSRQRRARVLTRHLQYLSWFGKPRVVLEPHMPHTAGRASYASQLLRNFVEVFRGGFDARGRAAARCRTLNPNGAHVTSNTRARSPRGSLDIRLQPESSQLFQWSDAVLSAAIWHF